MNDLKKDIKNALDHQVFNQITLSEPEAARFAAKLKGDTTKKPTKNRFQFVLPAVAVCLVLVISAYFAKDILFESRSPSADIENAVIEQFGEAFVIPEFDDYPITFAAITRNPFTNEPMDVIITYGRTKGKIHTYFDSEENRKEWERKNDGILLYGEYTGQRVLSIEYRLGKVEYESELVKNINGIDVEYDHLKRPAGEFVLATINVSEGFYFLQMTITDKFTLQDSDKVIDQITRQLKDIQKK